MRRGNLTLLLLVLACLVFWIGVGLLVTSLVRSYDGCVTYEPVPPHEPTGVKGCIVYGAGTASRWPGPGVARNDCVYPWRDCQPIRITAVSTGLSIVVTPTMYCDCYTTTPMERIVDLDPAAVAALGLDWADGVYDVVVTTPEQLDWYVLPDTAMSDSARKHLTAAVRSVRLR